tara:strand:+ start:44 stop:478 length:435 start_codon:yes stop_codon:yes gene_type:complete
MKTIEVKCYEFDELSDQAKENALSNYQMNAEYDWGDDAINSLKSFFNEIGLTIKDYSIDWLSPSHSEIEWDGKHNGRFVSEDFTGYGSDYSLSRSWNKNRDIRDAVWEFLIYCRDDYEYQISEEVYKELCEINEYYFDENGNLI